MCTEKTLMACITVVVICLILTLNSCSAKTNEQRNECYKNAKSDVQALLCQRINP